MRFLRRLCLVLLFVKYLSDFANLVVLIFANFANPGTSSKIKPA